MNELLARANEVFVKYCRLDISFALALTDFLDAAAGAFRHQGLAAQENELLALKAEFMTAEQGMNPRTLERITSNRREVKRAVALRVLQQASELLRHQADKVSQTLGEAELQLRPITLVAIQNGLAKGIDPQDQSELDTLWRALLKRPDTELPAREVAMQISPFDIQLLLGQLLAAADAEGPGSQVAHGQRERSVAKSRQVEISSAPGRGTLIPLQQDPESSRAGHDRNLPHEI